MDLPRKGVELAWVLRLDPNPHFLTRRVLHQAGWIYSSYFASADEVAP